MASEIRVNQIQNRSGLGTVTFSDTGVIISGVTTISDLRTSGTSVVAAGTTAAPSISPSGDSNTGIFFPSADTIAFAEGGVEAARINSSGNLGIGTNNPTTELEVLGTGTVASFRGKGGSSFIGIKDEDDGTLGFIGVDGGTLKFQTSGSGYSDKLIIDTSGNIGVGSAIPENKLDVNGTIKSYSGANKATFKDNQLRSDASGTFFFDHGTVSQSFTFRTSTSSSLDTTGPSITSAGNISFPSGKGIDFSATANSSGTMTSELLDDYEVGTFTPSFTGTSSNPTVSYLTQIGRYVKIGKMCYIEIRIVTNSVSSGSGEVRISGLPFTQASDNNISGGIVPAFVYNWSTNPTRFPIFGGSTYISMYSNDATNTTSQISHLNTGANANYTTIAGSYYTT